MIDYEDIDDNGAASVSSSDEIRCMKLQLPEHITAFLEERQLSRDLEPLVCDSELIENITGNYVIVKKIISNLSWQEKLLCKNVCSMWHSVVLAQQKEEMNPSDFSINIKAGSIRNGIKFLKSSKFYTEPLAVFAFTNSAGFMTSTRCESLVPSPCDPGCENEHHLIDVVYRDVTAPKNCMLTVTACFLNYLPLPLAPTYENAIRHRMFLLQHAFVGGICIPTIPNVQFSVINIKSVNSIQQDFYDVVDKLSQTRCIKGSLAFANDSYLLHSVEDIIFLNYFKTVQPNAPYALAGCVVMDTMSDHRDLNEVVDGINECKDYISDNLISIGLFSVPKNASAEDYCNFDMYSLILESTDWAKAKIESTINDFAKRVPHFEYSMAIKLSCVGRDQKHELEQQCFRTAFPNTRIVGCYGNGELGVNHPARPGSENVLPKSVKRHRRDPGPQYDVMYSYSTVIVYIGWGKILQQPESL